MDCDSFLNPSHLRASKAETTLGDGFALHT